MHKNAGQNLKSIAKTTFIVTAILNVIAALIISRITDTIVFLPILLPLSFIIAWNNVVVLYTIGELCENVYSINVFIHKNAYTMREQSDISIIQNQFNEDNV